MKNMCIKKIVKTGFLLFLISGTVITSGCTDNAQQAFSKTNSQQLTPSPDEMPDTDYEISFMKYVLNEMRNHGKDISIPLETYRIAKAQVRTKNYEGFLDSVHLFYEQCNLIMADAYEDENLTSQKQSD